MYCCLNDEAWMVLPSEIVKDSFEAIRSRHRHCSFCLKTPASIELCGYRYRIGRFEQYVHCLTSLRVIRGLHAAADAEYTSILCDCRPCYPLKNLSSFLFFQS